MLRSKIILTAFLALISAQAMAANLPQASNMLQFYNSCGQPIMTLPYSTAWTGTFKKIVCGNGNGDLTAAHFQQCYDMAGGAPYRVGGTTATVIALDYKSSTAASAFQFVTDTAAIAFNAAALTSGFYYAGATGQYNKNTAAANVWTCESPIGMTLGVNKYPGVQLKAAVDYSIEMWVLQQ